MRALLFLLLVASAVSETEAFIFGIIDAIVGFVTHVVGSVFDWTITTINKFVDTGFKIGGTVIGVVVDPFGFWKPSEDDHGHNTGKVAVCPARSDILFVIATSGSVESNEFDLAKKFASRLTEHFQIGDKDVRFSAITFSDRVQKVFDFDTYDKREQIISGISSTPFLGGSTKTYLALDYIRHQNLFSPSNGAREKSSKIVVVITDFSSDSLVQTITASVALKRLYHVVSVGIGSGLGLELHSIASGYTNVFTADDFSKLTRIEGRVARRLCEIPEADGYIPATGDGGGSCSKGFQPSPSNPGSCVDINECKGSHSCQDTCINIIGSYRCTCRAGSVIDPKDTSKCLSIRSCSALVDVIFVVDASGSIGSHNFKTQQTFIAKLTHHFVVGPKGAQFGTLIFATAVKKLFDLKTYSSRTGITSSILNAPYIEGGTNTHLALRQILDDKMFSPAAGGRSNAARVVLIVTDGDASNKESTKAAADALKAQGVQVFALAIGEQVDLAQLLPLVSNSKNVLGAADFDLLDYVEQSLAESICSSVW